MPERSVLRKAIWALGLTQIIGYGTLYYSFSILAPAMAREFGLTEGWVFAALSASLFAGSLFAPTAGRWADRFGAGRIMTVGSVAAAVALALCAVAPGRVSFVLGLLAMELASSFVLYSAAFVAIVQVGVPRPQRSITHLTLIAGFASTLFWPLTSALHAHLTWREVYLLFAALNLGLCLPIHAWLMRLSRRHATVTPHERGSAPHEAGMPLDARRGRAAFLLMLAGFATEGFVLSAILIHMVPLTAALGLGTAGLFVSTLFGPAQVASRLINMLFGGRLQQTHLAVIAASLLTAGLCALLLTTPWLPGAFVFVFLFGLGSGLTSIVGGTLPLELFGREGYGARLGWASAARQFTSAFAPFALAFMMARTSVANSLWVLVVVAASGVIAFLAIALLRRRGGPAAFAIGGSAEEAT
ncbi:MULTISPECIES: arsenite efflux MFS transporter ArsK [unclassified Mesorhizobium]|uniref:arsenite efflux MFS transporter ArsK n=2 Tax=Mesorhizobium TaxID=68287 RepID=UPI000FCC83DB|nr:MULTISPECIES: arsenite efflux MFS transporter ArsK [unclassified Mesorhizobium]RUX71112.1 MFS transporter [Mesorhizobium sp. M7A.F.Ca.US.005.03.1.1]RUY28476.1 MFS transporter [Mesorhizobium sp. M7A.F.Ca.US.001.04.2.1]RUY42777.1 MFS transporter [Mesorhizobium sp. M7A.F.Ca.US.001.04.1.1]RVA01844.1 MFS transporter [Mesorhizobium sp. M7A.F.Ca.US.001.02.1.1]RVA06240.1 MFS transporter [Mesorhizobium sp. M7A.F.Ca.US.002.01.1.1]